ncbi:hypothetical protein [Streptomyces sp. CoH17]|uniref:hypothetical protein n=1 Tax=Streptomyces sp. CoH17 TaxID=2992806 RepID=UPI002271C931|nr:hypothetical protein [Streptomyces sp. CoH17]
MGCVHCVGRRRFRLTTRALEAAGIPVLELHADNVDARSADGDALTRTVGNRLERHVLAGG